MGVQVAVPKEVTAGERRVALVPDVVKALVKTGLTVTVEVGSGVEAGYPDESFRDAGAVIQSDRHTLFGRRRSCSRSNPPPWGRSRNFRRDP